MRFGSFFWKEEQTKPNTNQTHKHPDINKLKETMPESWWEGEQRGGRETFRDSDVLALWANPAGATQAACDRQGLHTSAFKPYTGQEVFQSFKFLIGFLDGTVSLHIAGDVEADVINQRNGVSLLPFLHSLRILLHSSHKLLQLHQLDREDKRTIRKTRQQVKGCEGLG